jgi:hypothetical protein
MLTQQETALVRQILARIDSPGSTTPANSPQAQQLAVAMPNGNPRDPNMPYHDREQWMRYLAGFGVPMDCGPAAGPVNPPDAVAVSCGPGSAAIGCKVPITFSKTIPFGSSLTVELKPNQVGVPVGLDMTRSGDDIIVTDIKNYNKNSMYDQGDGDIVVALVANLDFNQETFESDSNPFPTGASRINRTYPILIDVTNASIVENQVAAGILWLRVS